MLSISAQLFLSCYLTEVNLKICISINLCSFDASKNAKKNKQKQNKKTNG